MSFPQMNELSSQILISVACVSL